MTADPSLQAAISEALGKRPGEADGMACGDRVQPGLTGRGEAE